MPTPPRARSVVVAAAVAALIAGLGVTAPAAADIPSDGLVASYDFGQSTGASVPNAVVDAGVGVGAATVRNVQPSDWTGSSLTLRGGAKTSTGNWVELPDDLLAERPRRRSSRRSRPRSAMLNGFHFLWNIGNESSATEYFFASLNCGSGRSPLVGLKTAGVEQLVSVGSCGVTANQWVNVASVVDGARRHARRCTSTACASPRARSAGTPANVVGPVAEHHRARAVARPPLPGRALVVPRLRACAGRRPRSPRSRLADAEAHADRAAGPGAAAAQRTPDRRTSDEHRHRPAHGERPRHVDLERPGGGRARRRRHRPADRRGTRGGHPDGDGVRPRQQRDDVDHGHRAAFDRDGPGARGPPRRAVRHPGPVAVGRRPFPPLRTA